MAIRFAAFSGFRRFHLSAASARGQAAERLRSDAPAVERRRPLRTEDNSTPAAALIDRPHDRDAATPFAIRM